MHCIWFRGTVASVSDLQAGGTGSNPAYHTNTSGIADQVKLRRTQKITEMSKNKKYFQNQNIKRIIQITSKLSKKAKIM